jgi:hypothetical protein
MVCLYAKFHIPCSRGSLVVAVKPYNKNEHDEHDDRVVLSHCITSRHVVLIGDKQKGYRLMS